MKQKKKRGFLIFPIIILISSLLMLFYVGIAKYYCEGNISLPLDDPFIFFQYARNMADGHFLKYNIEDPATTDVTSLLWQILLSFGFILGFNELKIIYWIIFGSLWFFKPYFNRETKVKLEVVDKHRVSYFATYYWFYQ